MSGERLGARDCLIACLAAALVTGCVGTAEDWEEGDRLDTAVARIRALESPLVRFVEVQGDIFDGFIVYVVLADGGRREAREVWCTLLRPSGLQRSDAAVWDPVHERYWNAPGPCS
jgi:hypothetical protein